MLALFCAETYFDDSNNTSTNVNCNSRRVRRRWVLRGLLWARERDFREHLDEIGRTRRVGDGNLQL